LKNGIFDSKHKFQGGILLQKMLMRHQGDLEGHESLGEISMFVLVNDLELQQPMWIHPVFHFALLETYKAPSDIWRRMYLQ
jgi:hypothetical protein